MKTKNWYYCLILIFFLISSCESQKNSEKLQTNGSPITVVGETMGTTYSIKYYGQTNYKNQIDSVLIEVNNSLSTYIPNSTISKINQAQQESSLDAHFKNNFLEAKKIFESTNGYFNPAVMPLVNYYGFGFENRDLSKIDSSQVEELLKLTDFNQFELKENTIYKNQPNAQLDFSALAKGYGVDEIGRFLNGQDITSYLIEIGGETLAKGEKPNGKKWTVGIRKPSIQQKKKMLVQKAVMLNNEAMATSGNYENFKILENQKTIAHTINPKTGFPQPLEEEILSSTVIAKTCMQADGYATAFKVMGLKESKEVLKHQPELKVFFIFKNENNQLSTWTNINF